MKSAMIRKSAHSKIAVGAKAALWGGLKRSGSVGWHKMAAKIL